jgi:serine/threonine protein kinase
MATVYLAEDLKHNRKIALKVLKPALTAVLGAERFLAEIQVTANLQHPHILPLFDSGEADGLLFYVMPYVEGESLRDKLDRETQLGVDEALSITSGIAAGLHYAHEHGVVHRDVCWSALGASDVPGTAPVSLPTANPKTPLRRWLHDRSSRTSAA